jgi:hypothetical protein
MKNFAQYYTPQVPLRGDIDALSDPQLDHERHREQVNDLVMNVALKYLALYLNVPQGDVSKIAEVASLKGRSSEKIVSDIFLALAGERVTPPEACGIQCLADIRSTAAIVKEVIFQVIRRKTDEGPFVSVDFGSGTGILVLASAIAGRRMEVSHALSLGFDLQPLAVDRSRTILNQLVGSSRVQIDRMDVSNIDFHKGLAQLPLTQWVSETISFDTPRMILDDRGSPTLVSLPGYDGPAPEDKVLVDRYYDPYFDVLRHTVSARWGFRDSVLAQRIGMFPNIFNGDYIPDPMNPRMRMRSSSAPISHVHLRHIGREFADYEDFQGNLLRRF